MKTTIFNSEPATSLVRPGTSTDIIIDSSNNSTTLEDVIAEVFLWS